MADALEAPYPNNGHWTYADYKTWELKPRERYEIIYGEAYATLEGLSIELAPVFVE